jgi:hypothetical protein
VLLAEAGVVSSVLDVNRSVLLDDDPNMYETPLRRDDNELSNILLVA